MLCFSFGLQAQQTATITFKPKTALDTVVNTANLDLVAPRVAGDYKDCYFYVSIERMSGTLGGKAYILGSHDGTNWFKQDSVTVTNDAAFYKVFTSKTQQYPYYKVNYAGTGTMVGKPKASVYLKRY